MRTIGSQGFSLYFHIPYCTRRCPYCHFYTVPDNEESKKRLTNAILHELDLRKQSIESYAKPLTSIYFGGGTPSLLGSKYIQKIINAAHIYTKDDVEITLETNPENLNEKILKEYLDIGINRLSIGAQSFNDSLLKRLGRNHSGIDIERSVEKAAHLGFKNISIDLMYEIPNQTLTEWEKSLERACSLPIQHISIYNLTIEPGTSFYKRKEILKKQIPKDLICNEMWELLHTYLSNQGWDHYEISAFCKEEKFSYHNIGYWMGRNFYGLGPSAFSYWDESRFQNTPHIENYITSISNNSFNIAFNEKLPKHEALAEKIAVALRVRIGIDLKSLELTTNIRESIKKLVDLGFAIMSEDQILRLSKKGRQFYDSVGLILVESYL